MRIFICLFLLFFSNLLFSQDCVSIKGKNKRVYKKGSRFIKKDRLDDALKILRPFSHPASLALKAEIYWLKGEDFKAVDFAKKTIETCPVSFPNPYYI